MRVLWLMAVVALVASVPFKVADAKAEKKAAVLTKVSSEKTVKDGEITQTVGSKEEHKAGVQTQESVTAVQTDTQATGSANAVKETAQKQDSAQTAAKDDKVVSKPETTQTGNNKTGAKTEQKNEEKKKSKKPAELRLKQKSRATWGENGVFPPIQQGAGGGTSFGPPPIYQMDEEGDENRQLLGALRQIKTDILSKSRQVRDDRRWVEQVRAVLVEYEIKMNRVVNHILLMRKEIKSLYKKKKQIENLMLQKKLEVKLKDATNDLTTLGDALDHVKDKEDSFTANKKEVETTIDIIRKQLNLLKNGGAMSKQVSNDLVSSMNTDPKAQAAYAKTHNKLSNKPAVRGKPADDDDDDDTKDDSSAAKSEAEDF